MKGSEIARLAKEQLSDLTGLKAGTVSGMSRDGDIWNITVEMIEMTRIPTAQDVLATYECKVSADGNLESYKRTRRYLRGDAQQQGEA